MQAAAGWMHARLEDLVAWGASDHPVGILHELFKAARGKACIYGRTRGTCAVFTWTGNDVPVTLRPLEPRRHATAR